MHFSFVIGTPLIILDLFSGPHSISYHWMPEEQAIETSLERHRSIRLPQFPLRDAAASACWHAHLWGTLESICVRTHGDGGAEMQPASTPYNRRSGNLKTREDLGGSLCMVFWKDVVCDVCEKSCAQQLRLKSHACKRPTFEGRVWGPFLLCAYVSVVGDGRPLWAIQWHFRTISCCRKPAAVFL